MDIINVLILILCLLVMVNILCQSLVMYNLTRIINALEKFKMPWDKLEKIFNDIGSRNTEKTIITASSANKFEQSKTAGIVQELPPEVVAPSLKKMQKSSGFGSNNSDKHSDT